MTNLENRLKKYVAFDTMSDPNSDRCPSSKGQEVFAEKLVEELKALGLASAYKDENGYVYAKLPGNTKAPAIGFISHMDTSPDMYGKCLDPQVLLYQGGDIRLNDQYSISLKDFPFLKDLEGQRLMTTRGDSLLGADDKAGIAIIMELVDYLMANPQIKRGDVCIAFTPDEEIGRGADLFNVKDFGADFAYTIDGGPEGELEYESFNAASANLVIKGKNVHPGSAKNVMINSQLIAMELESLLPKAQKPEYTEKYEGFFLLTNIEGNVEETKVNYIIRDHSRKLFEEKKDLFRKIVDFLNDKYDNRLELIIEDSYYNMKEKIQEKMEIVELAKQAYMQTGVEPNIKAIRGGTDGSKLSFMGLLTPNIFTGGYNYHGRFEFVSLDQMEKSFEIIKTIVVNNAM
ncbi:MAG: peptidase T [Tissierellia bacterium]|nr:peptidase T [Tissierellia bacterium]